MIMNDFQQIVREHFNVSDDKTRKYIIALEDAEQTQLLQALSSALYDKIVKNVDKIDFGSIPRSRGDITKVDGYENTMECLNIMRQLVMEYHEDPQIVNTVLTAVENIKSRKAIFMKAFAINAEFPTVLYNLIVLAIEQCVSFLISVCIQYIKDPASQSMSIALDRVAYNNSRDNLLYEQLVEFNKACVGSEMNEMLERIIKNGGKLSEGTEECTWGDPIAGARVIVVSAEDPKPQDLNPDHLDADDLDVEKDLAVTNTPTPVAGEIPVEKPMDRMPELDEQLPIHGCADQPKDGSVNEFDLSTAINGAKVAGKAIAIGGGVLVGGWLGLKLLRGLIKVVIPTMRKITYFLINTRIKFSDCISVQADFIQANAYKLQYSTSSDLSDEKRKKVIDKQLKIAQKMKNFANKIAIDNKKAEKSANQMNKEDEKPKNIDDLPGGSDDGGLF